MAISIVTIATVTSDEAQVADFALRHHWGLPGPVQVDVARRHLLGHPVNAITGL